MKTLVFVIAFSLVTAGQSAPSLTELQRLQVQVLTQRLEIAQLRAQAAQRDFDAARLELTALLKTLEVEGYTFDVGTLTYSPLPKPK